MSKMSKYRMPKCYKGHPKITSSVDDGTTFGRKSVTYSDKSYEPEPEKK